MSIDPKKKSLVICLLLIIFLLLQSSCADYGNLKDRTWIDYPQHGDQFNLGETVPITSHYYSEEGAAKVVVSINGQAVKDVESPDEVKPVAKVNHEWTPQQIGEFVIDVSVFTPEKILLSSAQVKVKVLEEKELVVEEPEVEEPAVGIFAGNGFCRYGPGTAYPAIAVFEAEYQVALEARSETLSPLWWYVSDLASDIFCWVSDAVIETEVNPESLMAMEAPPIPESGSNGGTGEEACHMDMDALQCIAAGGTWYAPIDILVSPYCICPE